MNVFDRIAITFFTAFSALFVHPVTSDVNWTMVHKLANTANHRC